MFEHKHTVSFSFKGNGVELQVKIFPPFLTPCFEISKLWELVKQQRGRFQNLTIFMVFYV